MTNNIFVFAGETSADLYGANLLAELRTRLPKTTFWGVGGPELSKKGFQSIIDIKAFQVMGFTDVLLALPRLTKNFLKLKNAILKKRPEMVICIDQPSFSIRLAKSLRKAGYKGKIVQFVAPTVWAYKPKRAFIMARYFDALLTLFDFEPAYFANTSLTTVFVGHPIVETIENNVQPALDLHSTRPLLAIFPGSRPAEIKRNLSIQLEAALEFQKSHPEYLIAVSCKEPIAELSKKIFQVPFSERYALMKRAKLAIAKSGTVTLELALHEVPTVVTYQLTWLNYLMAKYVLKLKIPYFSIVNILLQKELFYEQIYPPVTAENIKASLETWQNDDLEYRKVQEACRELKIRLKTASTPTHNAAEVICGLL